MVALAILPSNVIAPPGQREGSVQHLVAGEESKLFLFLKVGKFHLFEMSIEKNNEHTKCHSTRSSQCGELSVKFTHINELKWQNETVRLWNTTSQKGCIPSRQSSLMTATNSPLLPTVLALWSWQASQQLCVIMLRTHVYLLSVCLCMCVKECSHRSLHLRLFVLS